MNILESTRLFETWLRRRIPVFEADLAYKHQQMRADPFLFFRATFYRWAQLWPKYCPRLARGHEVMAVGDLHLENFGTWRDAEGRLVWGVNDFDEAHPMAFTNDLVRLATSSLLSLHVQPSLKLTPAIILDKLIEGYADAVIAGGKPFVLMERHPKLRMMATFQSHAVNLFQFWTRVEAKTEEVSEKALPDGLPRRFAEITAKNSRTFLLRD